MAMNHSVLQKFSTCCHEVNTFYHKCIILTHCNKQSLSSTIVPVLKLFSLISEYVRSDSLKYH